MNKTVIVIDHGLYLPLARKLGETFAKVYYYLPDSSPYPNSPKGEIGKGFEEIERIHDLWKYADKADLFCFFDIYDGSFQAWLRKRGATVFGSGLAEKLETDRVFFLEEIQKAGLAVPQTYRAEGLDDLIEHLTGKENKWLKTSYYRGDFETQHYRNMKHLASWLDDLRARVGRRAQDIEILVQNPVEAECEIGYDGFNVEGEFTTNSMAGYEIKDKGYICKIFPEAPAILAKVNEKLSPILKRFHCRGHVSTELRITKSGRPYFIDPTMRAPSPPSELMCEQYSNYAQAVWQIANGEVPELKYKAEYGAELILVSDWHEKHELHVEYPKEIDAFVKLKNAVKRRDGLYCIPNDNAGYFGAVIGFAGSLQKAIDLVLDRADQIKAEGFHFDSSVFDEAQEQVESGSQFGVTL